MPKLEDNVKKLLRDPTARKKATKNSLWLFSLAYFGHYLSSETPDFHYEMFADLENDDVDFLEVVAFRGSAKSTICSLIYPLWKAVTNDKDFIIILSDTHPQAKQIITNLIYELETNPLLIEDYGTNGTFKQKQEDWTATNIFMNTGTRITAKSRGQKVRGLRHLQHRPDLIIGDDVENIEDVRTKEQRDKTEEWFLSDVYPTLNKKTGKVVLIGNLLHTDSFYMRMRDFVQSRENGIYVEYSLFDENGNNRWGYL